jgi:hypothetical protein
MKDCIDTESDDSEMLKKKEKAAETIKKMVQEEVTRVEIERNTKANETGKPVE